MVISIAVNNEVNPVPGSAELDAQPPSHGDIIARGSSSVDHTCRYLRSTCLPAQLADGWLDAHRQLRRQRM